MWPAVAVAPILEQDPRPPLSWSGAFQSQSWRHVGIVFVYVCLCVCIVNVLSMSMCPHCIRIVLKVRNCQLSIVRYPVTKSILENTEPIKFDIITGTVWPHFKIFNLCNYHMLVPRGWKFYHWVVCIHYTVVDKFDELFFGGCQHILFVISCWMQGIFYVYFLCE